jgi:hypothetical protein
MSNTMAIETANEWAINNGYSDVETDSDDEFVAWQPCDSWDECPDATPFGVKAWRDPYRYRFVAIVQYMNGEQMGMARGFGQTMLEALQAL